MFNEDENIAVYFSHPILTEDILPGFRNHEKYIKQIDKRFVKAVEDKFPKMIDGSKPNPDSYYQVSRETKLGIVDIMFYKGKDAEFNPIWIGVSRVKHVYGEVYQVLVMENSKTPEELSMNDFNSKTDYLLRFYQGSGSRSHDWISSEIGQLSRRDLLPEIFDSTIEVDQMFSDCV